MVTITQEGNLSAPLSNALFQDLKFWISLMVPCRATLIADIKVNGGLVSQVERDADYCIWDHARISVMTDRPMYSYTFVLESIKRGRLEDLEKHLIDPSVIRPKKSTLTGAASGSAAKFRATQSHAGRRRTLFTTEEDLILLRTISQPGTALNGNKIYKTLEYNYPARTMHSWRGRWVDHFSKTNPDPEWWYKRLLAGQKGKGVVQEEDGPGEEHEGEEEEEEPVNPTKEVIAARPKVVPKSNLNRNKSKSMPSLGDDFTQHDDDILMAYHSTVVKAEDPLEAWEKLGEMHPHHPASKWRKRYNAVILPRVRSGEEWNPQESTSISRNPPPSSPPRLPSPRRRSHPLAQTSTAGERSAKPTPRPISPVRSTPPPPGVRNAASSSSKHEIPSRWHTEAPGLTSVPATDAPTVTSPHTDADADTAKPSKRKRIRPIPARFPLTTEIPSTPERGHRHKQQRRREPSPELGTSTAVSGDSHLSSPHSVGGDPITRPPLPSSPLFNPASSPLYNPRSSSPDPDLDLKIPSLPSSPNLAVLRPSTPDDELDAYLMVPPLASPTPSPTPLQGEEEVDEEEEDELESQHETLSAFVTRMKARFPGLTGPRIAWALKRTSADKHLAEIVIAAHMRGEGLPAMRGVWSEDEDAVVMGRDSRALQRLAEDRGEEWEYRLKFLEEWERSKPETRRSTV